MKNMNQSQIKIYYVAFFILSSMLFSPISASLSLPNIFSDKIVLQQQKDVKIWGTGTPHKKVTVFTSWDNKKTDAIVDSDSLWSVIVSTPSASYTKYQITIKSEKETIEFNDVLIGEVWLCSGQSNMHMPMKGYFNQPIKGSIDDIINSTNDYLRFFTVAQENSLSPTPTLQKGNWESASIVTTPSFSATAYYFGRTIQKILNIPVGLIHASWGGSKIEAWMSKEALAKFPTIKIPIENPEKRVAPMRATVIFNAMINPIIGYSIRGVIWYQGESSRLDYKIYPDLFKSMHEDWNKRWGYNFPIYFSQIAPYEWTNPLGPFMREAQLKISQEQPNTAMAVIADTGEKDIIHQADKRTVGERLAYIALAREYGFEDMQYRSPEFRSMNAIDNKVILRFNYAADGLNTFGRELKDFEIAGSDKIFYPADAKIVLNTVELYSPKVPNPVAVRYGFKNFFVPCLFGINGQPVSSFRSDDWDDIK